MESRPRKRPIMEEVPLPGKPGLASRAWQAGPGKRGRPLRRGRPLGIILSMASSIPPVGRRWGPPTLALDADRIVDTIAVLRRRIDERFPQSGLAAVCAGS